MLLAPGILLGQAARDSVADRAAVAEAIATGRWQDAVSAGERLVGRSPRDADLHHTVGQWLGWQGVRDRATPLLRRATVLAPDSVRYRISLGEVLSWSPDTRVEGVSILTDIVQRYPAQYPARLALARALSWSRTTRAQAYPNFANVLADSTVPASVKRGARADYGEALAWDADSRKLAPDVVRPIVSDSALALRATLAWVRSLAWDRHEREALRVADSLHAEIAKDSVRLAIHIARGELFVADGRLAQAEQELQAAERLAPSHVDVRRLAVQVGFAMGSRERASAAIASLPAGAADDRQGATLRLVELGVPTAEQDLSVNTNSFSLTTVRLGSTVSLPTGASTWRVRVRPGMFSSSAGRLYTVQAEVGVSTRLSPRTSIDWRGGVDQWTDAPIAWNGGVSMTHLFRAGVSGLVQLSRDGVEDSQQAARGEQIGDDLVGQVRATVLRVQLLHERLPGRVELQASVGSGRNTGLRLDANRRADGELRLRRVVNQAWPLVKVGVGTSWLGFDFDANLPPSELGASLSRGGNYWSPRNFRTGFATLSVSTESDRVIRAYVDGALGVSNNPRGDGVRAFGSIFGSVETRVAKQGRVFASVNGFSASSDFQSILVRTGGRWYFGGR